MSSGRKFGAKTRKAFKIRQRVKYRDTEIERFVADLLREMGVEFQQWRNIPCEGYSLEVDFLCTRYRGRDIKTVCEALGPYHFTPRQIRKTRWRSGLLTAKGHGVILLNYMLLKPQFREQVRQYLDRALAEAKPKVYEMPA